jgi:hypothetical protein
LVQVEYALVLMLDRMTKVEDLELSIETLDDITFHDTGTPIPSLTNRAVLVARLAPWGHELIGRRYARSCGDALHACSVG